MTSARHSKGSWEVQSRHFPATLGGTVSAFHDAARSGSAILVECMSEAELVGQIYRGAWRLYTVMNGQPLLLLTTRGKPRDVVTVNGVMQLLFSFGVRKMDIPLTPEEGLGENHPKVLDTGKA